MTPRQRRNHLEALGKAASAPRKSWLGKCLLLTGIQSGWIKSLLTIWGEGVGGKTAPRLLRSHACWNVIKGRIWSDKALERFTVALNQAREEGFRGQQAMNRAHSILWPQSSASVIDEALHNDDVDFVEQCVLQALDTGPQGPQGPAGAPAGALHAVGTFALAYMSVGVPLAPGATVAGGSLKASGIIFPPDRYSTFTIDAYRSGVQYGPYPLPGTWRACGIISNQWPSGTASNYVGLFQRIS